MRVVSVHTVNGKTIITTEERFFLFWKKERKFEAQREYPHRYWDWLELPDRTVVSDALSLQLNAWNRIENEGTAQSVKRNKRAEPAIPKRSPRPFN